MHFTGGFKFQKKTEWISYPHPPLTGEFNPSYILKIRAKLVKLRQKNVFGMENKTYSINIAMSMFKFKLSITPRCALMAARGWARLILDRGRDLINDRPNRANAAEAPLDGA